MRMILKNKSIKKINFKNHITKKNLFIFLIFFSVINMIIGGIFFLYLNSTDKNMIINNINNYFVLEESLNYLNMFKETIILNYKNLFIIWVLGVSIIGIIFILFLLFIETFSIGFTITGIIYSYGFKGILGNILYFFPCKLFYFILLFLISFFAISFSYKLIMKLIKKAEETNINKEFNKYLKILVIFALLFIVYSILETFLTPFLIKIFTFLVK